MNDRNPLEGGCSCGEVRYRLTATPLIVHCCHCRWCQRETGSAFAVNALIEASEVETTAGEPVPIDTPSESGQGQKIWRCPTCRVALWSHYGGAGPSINFIRAGTLDDTTRIAPDIHIYTASKQPWVKIPEGEAAVPEFYKFSEVWPAESIERSKRARAGAG